jgi:hypothetical protein
LIDGWGDILLLLTLDLTKVLNEDPDFQSIVVLPNGAGCRNVDPARIGRALKSLRRLVAVRVAEITELRKALYNHFLVARTESAYTPIVADIAIESMSCGAGKVSWAGGELELFQTQVRLVADRVTGDVSRQVEGSVRAWATRSQIEPISAAELLAQAGSYDYSLRIDRLVNARADLARNYFDEFRDGRLVSQVECLTGIRRQFVADNARISGGGGLLYISGYANIVADAFLGVHHLIDKVQTAIVTRTRG